MIDIETMKQTRDMYIEAVSVINNITAKLMKMGSGATELPDYTVRAAAEPGLFIMLSTYIFLRAFSVIR